MFWHSQPPLMFCWAAAALVWQLASCFKIGEGCSASDLHPGCWRADWNLKLCSSCLAFWQNGFKIWTLPCHQGTAPGCNRSWLRKPWEMESWLFTCSAKQSHWYAGDFSLCDFQCLPQHQNDISKRLRTERNIGYPFKAKTSDLMKAVSEWDMIPISNYICLAQHSLINHSNI